MHRISKNIKNAESVKIRYMLEKYDIVWYYLPYANDGSHMTADNTSTSFKFISYNARFYLDQLPLYIKNLVCFQLYQLWLTGVSTTKWRQNTLKTADSSPAHDNNSHQLDASSLDRASTLFNYTWGKAP